MGLSATPPKQAIKPLMGSLLRITSSIDDPVHTRKHHAAIPYPPLASFVQHCVAGVAMSLALPHPVHLSLSPSSQIQCGHTLTLLSYTSLVGSHCELSHPPGERCSVG